MIPYILPQILSNGAMTASPQQFCLRWNNHQSNIISVFEQLLHSEAFVDVTLAVEGMSLKAHKVVLSACSPYFQAVLASHPDKHPIVILKDVRYVDMRDLLDFMYRGEVSVDQDNLSGFLRVAESLRIKGLTEVNEKKRLESSGTPFLLSQAGNNVTSGAVSTASHIDIPSLKRPPLSPTGSFSSSKRRRGRPPKISGEESEGETGLGNATHGGSLTDGEESRTDSESKDIKVEAEDFSSNEDGHKEKKREGESRTVKSAGPSGDLLGKDDLKIPKEEPEHTRESPSSDWSSSTTPPVAIPALPPPAALAVPVKRPRGRPPRVPRQPQDPSKWPPLLPKPSKSSTETSKSKSSSSRISSGSSESSNHRSGNSVASSSSTSVSPFYLTPTVSVLPTTISVTTFDSPISSYSSPNLIPPFPIELRDLSAAGLPGGVLPLSVELGDGFGDSADSLGVLGSINSDQPMGNIQDMTEGVQMGIKVRGLDLMRYGRLENGIYRCTSCEKIQIMKTFKTSYSFQRHAYLYHEGSPKRFPCPNCGKEFSRPDKRKSHLKEKHGLFQMENIEANESHLNN